MDHVERFIAGVVADNGSPPFTWIETRSAAKQAGLLMFGHKPNPGIRCVPAQYLTIGVVQRSHSRESQVIRRMEGDRLIFKESPGLVVLTPANTEASYSGTGMADVLQLLVPWSYVRCLAAEECAGLAGQVATLAAKPFRDTLISNLALRIWQASARTCAATSLFLDHALICLISSLILRTAHRLPNELHGRKRVRHTVRLAARSCERAKDLMMSNMATPLTNSELARSIGLSPYHFVRAFRNTVGESPYQWLIRQRIDRAKQLLVGSDRLLTHIAIELGFSSSSHFSTTFRKATGCTPSGWRSEMIQRA